MNFKFLKIVFVCFFILTATAGALFATLSTPVFAEETFKIEQPEGPFGLRVNTPDEICQGTSAEGIVQDIVTVVAAIFFTVGAVGVLIFFLWGSVEWILSGGDKEKVANARKRITHAIIGLVLLSLSYFILRVISQISGFDIFGNLQIPGIGEVPEALRKKCGY